MVVIQQPVGLSGTPSPANGAISVALSSTLSWTAATNATGYNVYFGTASPPPLVSSSQAGLTYSPGTLISNTTYYWRIDPLNSCGANTGIALAFTTTIQQYTSSSIFSVPAGITSIKVQSWGGGG